MQNNPVKKGLAVVVILLFIGITVAPSYNFNVIKASAENNFIEITTIALGIPGVQQKTAKLTKDQYYELKDYLTNFQNKLNNTVDSEKTEYIFKEAFITLNKFGLLPNGLTNNVIEKLFINKYHNLTFAGDFSFLD